MPLSIAYHDGNVTDEKRRDWEHHISTHLPDCQLVPLTHNVAYEAEIALVWKPPEGRLAELPNLKLVISLGQGVDHVMGPGKLPAHVQLARLVDPDMSHALSQWVLLSVLDHLRDGPAYRKQSKARLFSSLPQRPTSQLPVAVYGMGAIGSMIASRLDDIGFDVHGWSRSERQQDASVILYYGPHGFEAMLDRCQVHICILPLTDETYRIFNAETFSKMPKGAYFINGGRGAHVNEADLLNAISSGHLAGATLDVFEEEPLPIAHPFWDEPRITIWPHVAAQTNPETAALQVADAIRAVQAGKLPANLVDRQRGY